MQKKSWIFYSPSKLSHSAVSKRRTEEHVPLFVLDCKMGTFEYKHVFQNICSICLIFFIYLFNDAALTAVYFDHKCEYCETELSESFPCYCQALVRPAKNSREPALKLFDLQRGNRTRGLWNAKENVSRPSVDV